MTSVQSEDLTKLGTFKDWNAVAVFNETGKICFAYSIPVSQSPKASNREARLFVSFRPEDKIADEVSITSGYDFNSQNTILATSGKSKFEFDLPQNKFAWISSGKTEQKIIKRMKNVRISFNIKLRLNADMSVSIIISLKALRTLISLCYVP